MAENTVTITKMPTTLIGKSDVIFEIKVDGGKLGNLRVSKGTLYWRPTNKQSGYYLNWPDFARLMIKNGHRYRYNF